MDNNINNNSINVTEVMKGTKVLLCPTYDLAISETVAKVDCPLYATVEAEYGDKVVQGSPMMGEWGCLAHHGSRSSNPAPCIWNTRCSEDTSPVLPEVIIVSHLDLDSLGGIGLLLGYFNESEQDFWNSAAYIDCSGPHHILEIPEKAQKQLRAFWAYNEYHRPPQFPRDAVTDVTSLVAEYFGVLDKIAKMDPETISSGEEWEKKKSEQVESSLVYESTNIRGFAGAYFTAASYCGSDAKIRPCTVSYSTKKKSITLAFEAGKDSPFSAVEIMQSLFGNEAGGHRGIAGTPRGKEFNVLHLAEVIKHVEELLSK